MRVDINNRGLNEDKFVAGGVLLGSQLCGQGATRV